MIAEINFIYRPTSGDRVFNERHVTTPGAAEAAAIGVIEHPNGSRHVVGGVRLIYHAASPGRW